MFSSALHFLALVSFAVHTVFGCCAHHAHAGEPLCCPTTAHECNADSQHGECCDHHSHATSGEIDNHSLTLCGGHQCMSGHESDHHNHAPHKCCELRCVYITASTVTTSDLLDNDALIVAILPTDSRWYSDRLYYDQNSHQLGISDIHSASVRCVLTQSWQI